MSAAETEDSACLTVDDPSHAFVIEGGIVVANCIRYHVASRPAAAIEPEKSHPSGTLAEVMAAHRAAKQERGIAARPGERLRSRWR